MAQLISLQSRSLSFLMSVTLVFLGAVFTSRHQVRTEGGGWGQTLHRERLAHHFCLGSTASPDTCRQLTCASPFFLQAHRAQRKPHCTPQVVVCVELWDINFLSFPCKSLSLHKGWYCFLGEKQGAPSGIREERRQYTLLELPSASGEVV